MNNAPITAIGRRGRKRSPASPPASAPIASPVTTTVQADAPPIDCFATYGPSTKKGA